MRENAVILLCNTHYGYIIIDMVNTVQLLIMIILYYNLYQLC